MKKAIIIAVIGSMLCVRQVIEASRIQEEKEIRRRFEEPSDNEVKALPISNFPRYWNSSDRKGKGQKAREASQRRKRGW